MTLLLLEDRTPGPAGLDRPGFVELIGVRPRWMLDALCREFPEVAFHPAKGHSTAPAKAICARCLVRCECLAWALETGDEYGVLGGTSRQDRQNLMRAGADRCPSPPIPATESESPMPMTVLSAQVAGPLSGAAI